MRVALALVPMLMLSGITPERGPQPVASRQSFSAPGEQGLPDVVQVSQLSSSAAGLFLRLVNERLKGRIDPRSVAFVAPAGVLLEDAVLTGPGKTPVARVKRALVQVSLRALFSGEIVISSIDIDEPRLLLELKDGKLNLLEALSPKKPPDPNAKGPETSFRIGDITVKNGGFRFNDGENVTIVLDGINAHASVDVNLGAGTAVVDVDGVNVDTGSVKLKALDVPLRRLSANRIRVITDQVELTNVRASALGDGARKSAALTVDGRIDIKGDGNLRLTGRVKSDAGAWPDRLDPLPFVTPSFEGKVDVNGAFARPVVAAAGAVGGTTIAGYAVDGGVVNVVITPSDVSVNEGTLLQVGRGAIRATGTVALPTDRQENAIVDIRARVADVPLGVALAPAELDTTVRGAVSGTLRISGPAGKKTSLAIAGDIRGRDVQLFDLRLPKDLSGDVKLTASPDRVSIARVALRGTDGTTVSVGGDVDLRAESLSLQVDAVVADANALVAAIPADVKVGAVAAAGTISGPFKTVGVDVVATVAAGAAYGVPFSQLKANVGVSAKELRVTATTGVVAKGKLTQSAPLRMVFGKGARAKTTFQSGTFTVTTLDIAAIKTPEGGELPVVGRATLEASLRGTTEAPRIPVRLAAGDVFVRDEHVGDVTATIMVTKEQLTFTSVTTSSPVLRASTDVLTLNTENLYLQGIVDIRTIELGQLKAAASAKLLGQGRGIVVLTGPATTPTLRAELSVRGLSLAGIPLGTGPVALGLGPDEHGDDDSLIVSVSSKTSAAGAKWQTQLAYAIDRDVLNGDVRIENIALASLIPKTEAVVPLSGRLGASVVMSGPLSAPDAAFQFDVQDLVAQVPTTEKGVTKARMMGDVSLNGRIDAGVLSASMCAFADGTQPNDDVESPCDGAYRLWANVSGQVNPRRPSAQLLIDGNVAEANVEQLVPALSSRFIGVGGVVRVAAAIDVPQEGPITTQLSANVIALDVRPPDAPEIHLVSPVELDYIGGRAVIGQTPAHFATNKAGFDLIVAAGSSVGAEDVDVSIDGAVALAAIKVLTDSISNASGIANTHIKASGRFDEGVLVSGTIEPQPGARLTPRALGQAVVFDAARISISPNGADLGKLLVTFDAPCGDDRGELCPLRATVGDGQVLLRGTVLARTSRQEAETWVERFDLGASATGVEVRSSYGRVETGFDLALVGNAPNPELKGRLDVTDGLLRKEFQLRNFILTAAPARPSDPIWQTLTPFGLGEMTFDVAASMLNVRTKARINSFSVDASLRGDLRLTRTLKFPGLDGAIEVESGTVAFPRANFDIVELQLQFPTSPDGSLNPTLHLSARAELPAGSAGNSVEVPVDLSLDGSFDAMLLDLTAVDPNRQWTRSELFAHILFGVIPQADAGSDLFGAGAEAARSAAFRELSAPVNREFESLVESGLGLDVNIDIVSLAAQVQLGRRLVLEGQLSAIQPVGTDSTLSTTTGGTSGSVRLLLFDHLPVGQSWSLEGRLGLVSDLRMSWRLFEE